MCFMDILDEPLEHRCPTCGAEIDTAVLHQQAQQRRNDRVVARVDEIVSGQMLLLGVRRSALAELKREYAELLTRLHDVQDEIKKGFPILRDLIAKFPDLCEPV